MPAALVSSSAVPVDARGGRGLFAWSRQVQSPGSVRLGLTGELDLSGVEELGSALLLTPDGIDELVIDLADLDFVDGAALRCLVRAGAETLREGGRLRLVGDHGQVSRVLDLLGEVLPAGGRIHGL